MEKIKIDNKINKQYDRNILRLNRNKKQQKYRMKKRLAQTNSIRHHRVTPSVVESIKHSSELAPPVSPFKTIRLTMDKQRVELANEIQNQHYYSSFESQASLTVQDLIHEPIVKNKSDDCVEYLFESSSTSVKDFLMCLLSIKFKHKLSTSACDDILKLIQMVLPSPNKCPLNSSVFDSLFDDSITGNVFDICVGCNNVTKEPDLRKRRCKHCDQELDQFFTCNNQPQLIQVLSRPNFIRQVKASNKRGRQLDSKLHDVIDGQLYKEALKEVPSDKLCVSLCINTDGSPLATSASFNLWPMLATILELEPMSRENFKNMIFLGKLKITF
jgi:hypothetical protein